MSTLSDSDAEDAAAFELDELDLGDEEGHGGGRAAGGIEAAGRANVDLRMERLPPGQTYSPPRSMRVMADGRSRTGPKGVLDDYKEAQRQLRQIRMRDSIARERAVNKQTLSSSSSLNVASSDSNSDSASDEDDTFREYVQQRKEALLNSLPVFGVYRRVESRAGFAELVSSVHSHVWVVAHLYSNSVELCARLHFALDALAASFEHVLFVRVRAEDVMAGFAEAGLPAFMLYKDGKCVANALRLGDVLPPHFSDADVARLLQSKNVLQLPDGTEWMEEKKRQRKKAAPKFTLSRAANSDDNSDGD